MRQDFDHRRGQRVPARPADPRHRARRVDAGTPERFRGVDVADADDQPSVHQEALDRPAPSAGQAGERRAVEALREGFDAEPAKMDVALDPIGLDHDGEAEAPRIAEAQPQTAVELEGEMLMGLGRPVGARHRQTAAHPEMDHQRLAALEIDEQVLRTPPQPLDPPAGHTGGESAGDRHAQAPVAHLDGFDPPPDEMRLQAELQDLDFGQLRHGDDSTRRRG